MSSSVSSSRSSSRPAGRGRSAPGRAGGRGRSGETPVARTGASSRRRWGSRRRAARAVRRSPPPRRRPWPAAARRPAARSRPAAGQFGVEVLEAQVDAEAAPRIRERSRASSSSSAGVVGVSSSICRRVAHASAQAADPPRQRGGRRATASTARARCASPVGRRRHVRRHRLVAVPHRADQVAPLAPAGSTAPRRCAARSARSSAYWPNDLCQARRLERRRRFDEAVQRAERGDLVVGDQARWPPAQPAAPAARTPTGAERAVADVVAPARPAVAAQVGRAR